MLQELVTECIINAYDNGYGQEIEDMTDEELAWDILDHILDHINHGTATYDQVLSAIIKFWEQDNA